MAVDQIQDVIQRWRDTPEGGLKPEDHQLFQNVGSACIAQGDSVQMLSFIQDDKNQQIVRSMGSGLIAPLLSDVLTKGRSQSHCQAAMTHLAKTCSPEELLCALLEQLKDIHPDAIADTITVIIPHLQTVLLRLAEGKARAVGQALSALQKQMSRLPVPYNPEQEAADKYGLCRCCTALAMLVEPFVEEVKRSDNTVDATTATTATTGDSALKSELLKFCMESLREPLLQAQLVQTEKTPLRIFATNVLLTLPAIQEPLPELLFYRSLRKTLPAGNTQSQESRACLAYLLFVNLITIERFPAIYSSVFVLQCNMEYINILLSSRKDEAWVLKGMALFATSLEQLEDNSLSVELLELRSFYTAPQSLLNVLTDCPIQHLRERGLVIFQLFINKLDVEAKHKFFRCLLKTSHHAGVHGYVIKNIRNQVDFSMKPGNGNDWFLGSQFLPLLGLVLCLPQGPETDLLQGMDRIMESLNLLRFLLIKDNHWKSVGDAWTELWKMKDDYLRMMNVCISLSRSYYGAEVKTLRDDQRIKAREARVAGASNSKTVVQSMTVRQEKVSDMPPEVQYQVLQSAMVTFDLMESLIFWIEDLTKEKSQHHQLTKTSYSNMTPNTTA